jgi:catechol 2,3-dioxygenase-like lactoylglutathione lyase family enzyme
MPKLDAVHPVLMCRDVPTSLGFFGRLGFAVDFQDSSDPPRYAVIARDGVQLHLQWADHTQWAYPIDRPVYRILVGDVDALYDEFKTANVLSEEALGRGPWRVPADTPWGTREFHLRDPGENGLQFYHAR